MCRLSESSNTTMTLLGPVRAPLGPLRLVLVFEAGSSVGTRPTLDRVTTQLAPRGAATTTDTLRWVAPGFSLRGEFTFRGSLDLRATLGPGARVEPGGRRQEHWRAVRTPQGPATTQLRVTGNRIEAQTWGPGAAWALEAVPELVGLDDHGEGFVAHHRIIDHLHRQFPGLRIGRTGLIWHSLPLVILEQKVTGPEAKRSWRSLVKEFGEDAPGPRPLRLGPAAEVLAPLAYHDFHPHGVERRRAETILNAARRIKRVEEAASMAVEDAYRRLMAFSGIGIWTASLVLGEAIGDPDAIPIGDYHEKNTVSWALADEPRGSDERMVELLEPYRGHRQRVMRLLHLGGVSAPKYGPRTRPRDIRSH